MEKLVRKHSCVFWVIITGCLLALVTVFFAIEWALFNEQEAKRDSDVLQFGRIPTQLSDSPQIAFSLDGQMLAIATENAESTIGNITIWNTTTCTEYGTWNIPGWTVSSLAFLPDGRSLVCGIFREGDPPWDTSLRLLNIRFGLNEKHRFDFGNDNNVIASLAFTPNGQILAVLEAAGVLRLWDVSRWNQFAVLNVGGAGGSCVTFSPDGQTLAVATDNNLKLLDVKSRKWRLTLSENLFGIVSCSISPDGKYIAALVNDQSIKIWDMKTGKLRDTIKTSYDYANFISFTEKNNELITFGTNDVQSTLAGVAKPSGASYTVGSSEKEEGTVILWSLKQGFPSTKLIGPTDGVQLFSFCASRMLLATGNHDSNSGIELWDISQFSEIESNNK